MPATPVFQPSAPVVQSTAPVEQRIAEARAAAEAEQASSRATDQSNRPSARQASARQAAPTPESTAMDAPAAPVMSPAAATAAPTPPAPSTTDRAPADMPAAAATAPSMAAEAPAEAARTDQALLWAMGGGALLLMGLGGAMVMRRRRPVAEDGVVTPTYATAAAMPEPAPAMVDPARTTPVEHAPASRPAIGARPAMAPAMVMPQDATLDAMVAAPPSPENPFTTRAKRTRRARFLLAQRAAAARTPDAPQTVHAEPVAPHGPATQDRSQMVYRFDKDGPRSGFLKPRTR